MLRGSVSLSEVDRSILLELIKLSRFNAHFYLEANKHEKWRVWLYPLTREAGTAATFSANLIQLREQAKGLDHPERINKNAIKKSVDIAIIGNAISASASAVELTQNLRAMRRVRRHGYGSKESVAYVKEIFETTNTLFNEREQLSSLETNLVKRRVCQTESALLKRIRQQLLYEFVIWSSQLRDQAWRENSFYVIDTIQNFTRMTSGIVARKALAEPRLAGAAAISGLVGNSLLTVNPIFCNLIGAAMGRRQRHKLAKGFSIERPAMLADDSLQKLQELQRNLPDEKQKELLTDTIAFGERSQRLDKSLDRETKEIQRYQEIAQQQAIVGPLVGLTGVASSVLAVTAFYGYRHKPTIPNKIQFPGRISATAGQGIALIVTPYTMFAGMLRAQRLKARGQLPSQILEQRLKNLDRMEDKVKSSRP